MANASYVPQKLYVSNEEEAKRTSSHMFEKIVMLLEKGELEKALFVCARTCSGCKYNTY